MDNEAGQQPSWIWLGLVKDPDASSAKWQRPCCWMQRVCCRPGFLQQRLAGVTLGP